MTRLFATLLLSGCTALLAAQRIDINNNSNRTEEDYLGWTFANAQQAQTTVDGITLKLAVEAPAAGRTLKCEWWKDGVNKYSRLVCDGVGVYGLDANGNTPQLQSGAVGMTLTLSGLSAGEHSLLAYHNNPSGYSGPPIDVYVDGERQLSGVLQTNRAQQPSQSGTSYVHFTARQGESVTIVYRTVPDPAVDYTQGYQTTSLFINALVFDRPNPLTTAADPYPEHLDEHADCDGGRVVLTWTPAEPAVKHHVLVGTESGQLTEVATVTEPRYELTGLDPAKTYYWAVSEEMSDGTRYDGDQWWFRPRRLAFPDAEGYGRFAIGGRGGTVYHVTSLLDDPANPQPGTLRYGISRLSGPRTIVFDVGGVIELKSRLTCSDKYVTVAGQTAPGRGIMLRGAPFGMQSDGITRFLRLRLGYHNGDTGKGLDGLGMAGNDHSIMDHCSIAWTIDEGFSSRNAKHITLQRTLISEALNVADHPNYGPGTQHGYAATIGGGEMGAKGSSFHHNLLAHNEGRNWSVSGGLDGAGFYDGHHDIFNNVVYNWGGRATDGGTHELNFVANYYKKGPATTQNFLLNHDFEGTGQGTQRAYVSGNIRQELNGTLTRDQLNVTYKCTWREKQTTRWEPWAAEPFFPSYARVQTAEEAYQDVLSDVGCNQPELDNHDRRMVSETLSGTTTTVGSKSGKKGLIDRETDAEGFDGLNIISAQRPDGWDTDQDGMPDWYERLAGTDVATPNNNHYADNGYTDLENYLEWLAHPHFVAKPETSVSIDLRPYFAGYPDFEVAEDFVHDVMPGAGFVWSFQGSVLRVQAEAPMMRSLPVTVRDKNTGATMTRRFNFAFTTDETAAITSPAAEAANAAEAVLYDLQGRRISAPRQGSIFIRDGRKTVR